MNKTKKEGGKWVAQCLERPLFVYAPIRNIRQQMQSGRYILFPNKVDNDLNEGEKCFEKVIEPISKSHRCIAERIRVPSTVKSQIISELQLFGISKETLFCDNIDIVCSGIVNQFVNSLK